MNEGLVDKTIEFWLSIKDAVFFVSFCKPTPKEGDCSILKSRKMVIFMSADAATKVTAFQARVYAACRRVPRGRVSTYGDLAAAIGCGSARAVGQALKRNPFAPEVPCHRVVGADGGLGGFMGQRTGEEVVRKRRLLEGEGVELDAHGRVRPEFVWKFSLAKGEGNA